MAGRGFHENTVAQSIDECYQEILDAVKNRLSDFVI